MIEQIFNKRNDLILLQKEEKHHSNISKVGLACCITCPSKKKCKTISVELAELEGKYLSRKQ